MLLLTLQIFFYSGEKGLDWKIDYLKLLVYLKKNTG